MGYSNKLIAGIALCALLFAGCATEEDAANPPTLMFPAEPLDSSNGASGCDVEFGRTFIMERFEIPDENGGRDHDGDGEPDNALAFLGQYANAGWIESIASGSMMYMFDVTPWLDDPSITTSELGLAFYQGIDIDGDPTNNTSGSDHFMVPAEQFDVSCRPTGAFENVLLDNTFITADRDTFTFVLPDYGSLEFHDMVVELDVAPDMSALHGTASGVWTYCSLSRSPFPGAFPGSFLDLLLAISASSPDIDRDGDGMEQIVSNGDGVERCIDGDGTEIVDPFCPCDPRIVDGYSIAFEGWAVPATIEGIAPAP